MSDLRLAFRTLAKNPGFSIIAILTLALGIGANTAIFTIVNGVLLSPLPYPDAERIVALTTFFPETGARTPRLTGGDLMDIRDDGQMFDAFSSDIGGEVGVQMGGRAEFTGTYWVTPAFFHVFAVQPAYGRLIESTDGETAALVSRTFAERNFGNASAALGKTLSVENRTYSIVGVLPAGFQYPAKADVWVPGPATPENLNRTSYNYPTVAKLKAGITVEAANARLQTIGTRLAAAFPKSNAKKTFQALPLRDQLVGPVRSTLFLLMGAVGLVLLIACTNVADLMLARATGRWRELAVRTALGAGRWHIIRPLAAESLLLALAGGALGLLLAMFGADALVHTAGAALKLPRLDDIHLDRSVLLFASAISIFSCLLFGLAPAWQAGRANLNDALKQGGSRGTLGGRSARLRNSLVVAQIALSFVLAIGAGLLLRSFYALTTVPLGYRTEGILVMYAHAPAHTLEEHLGVGHLFDNLFGELSATPGAKSVAAAMGLPTGRYGSNGSYAVEGKHVFGSGQKLPYAGFRLASPGYFNTMGIPLLRGREFDLRDRYDAPFVAIISDALARQSFPNEEPIGKRIQCGLDSLKWMTVVGIVAGVRQDSPATPPGPELYMPLNQHPFRANELQVVVRTAVPPASMVPAVREKVHAMNPEIAMKFTTMETMVGESIATPRVRMFLIGAFAALALLLAMIGVYGVMSYIVTERTSEFGLRVALGASPKDVVTVVLGRALRLGALGIAIGLTLSLIAGRLVANMLFGIRPADGATYIAVLLAVTPVVVFAAAVPAWRAARVDPLIALREE